MVEKKEAVQWHILRSFNFGKKSYHLGEPVPYFISKKRKEELYYQGYLGKIKPDGTLDKVDPLMDFNPQDLLNIANSPQLIIYILGEYALYKEDLEEIWKIVQQRNYAKDYEKLIKDKIKIAPSKNPEPKKRKV